jgi:hypothetical protein
MMPKKKARVRYRIAVLPFVDHFRKGVSSTEESSE